MTLNDLFREACQSISLDGVTVEYTKGNVEIPRKDGIVQCNYGDSWVSFYLIQRVGSVDVDLFFGAFKSEVFENLVKAAGELVLQVTRILDEAVWSGYSIIATDGDGNALSKEYFYYEYQLAEEKASRLLEEHYRVTIHDVATNKDVVLVRGGHLDEY